MNIPLINERLRSGRLRPDDVFRALPDVDRGNQEPIILTTPYPTLADHLRAIPNTSTQYVSPAAEAVRNGDAWALEAYWEECTQRSGLLYQQAEQFWDAAAEFAR